MNWIHENLLAVFSLLLNLVALALIGFILINQNKTMSSIHDATAQMKAIGAGAINKPDDLGPRINLLDTSLNKIDSKLGQLDIKLNEIDAKPAHSDSKPAGVDVKLMNKANSKLDKIDSRLADIQAESRKLDSKITRIDDAIKEMKKQQARNGRGYVFP
ncbi:MAG: hypothetical protein PHG47_08560 [Sulfuricella sp.]|nr:hypothetical protein [Sulfuricella sp.]